MEIKALTVDHKRLQRVVFPLFKKTFHLLNQLRIEKIIDKKSLHYQGYEPCYSTLDASNRCSKFQPS